MIGPAARKAMRNDCFSASLLSKRFLRAQDSGDRLLGRGSRLSVRRVAENPTSTPMRFAGHVASLEPGNQPEQILADRHRSLLQGFSRFYLGQALPVLSFKLQPLIPTVRPTAGRL